MALLTVEADLEALAVSAAHRVTALLQDAVAQTGTARLCLTGGQTPRGLYRLLGQPGGDRARAVDWARVALFWGDERHVAPDHPDSNFGMANQLLVQPARVPASHVHRIRGELADPAEAAREYDGLVRQYERPGRATFDVMLLGLGNDAHIASIFPRSPLLARRKLEGPERAAAVWAPHLDAWRITLTPRAILDAAAVLVLTAGKEKAAAVRAALRDPDDVDQWPAQLLRTSKAAVEWWVDREAAAAL